jgi:anti-sigma regulatory factor (Ser/Thr protein kinase)
MNPVSFDKEIRLRAAVDELDKLLEWLEAALEEAECPPKVANQIQIAAEELFINIAKYAYEIPAGENSPAGQALIRVAARNPFFYMQFEDSGTPFNPLEQPEVNTKAGIDERKIGGLGIYMIMKWMDEVSYIRADDKNILTLQKKYKEE